MAGNYPDVPGPRMAYDRDGSVGFKIDSSNNITQLTQGQIEAINNESDDAGHSMGGFSGGWYVGIIFPELRDIVAFFLAGSVQDPGDSEWTTLQSSVDTTSGLDGTWVTERASGLGRSGIVVPYYRTGIQSEVITGVKALRFYMPGTGGGESSSLAAFHIYGKLASGETPDRLRLWHPTLNQALDDQAVSPDGAYFDWGNTPRGTTQDRTFRVKNNSATYTAEDILLSIESLSPAAIPEVHTLSNGGAFGATTTITSLAPGAISDVCTLRRTTPVDATFGPWVARILAEAEAWT